MRNSSPPCRRWACSASSSTNNSSSSSSSSTISSIRHLTLILTIICSTTLPCSRAPRPLCPLRRLRRRVPPLRPLPCRPRRPPTAPRPRCPCRRPPRPCRWACPVRPRRPSSCPRRPPSRPRPPLRTGRPWRCTTRTQPLQGHLPRGQGQGQRPCSPPHRPSAPWGPADSPVPLRPSVVLQRPACPRLTLDMRTPTNCSSSSSSSRSCSSSCICNSSISSCYSSSTSTPASTRRCLTRARHPARVCLVNRAPTAPCRCPSSSTTALPRSQLLRRPPPDCPLRRPP